mgnify:FL=1
MRDPRLRNLLQNAALLLLTASALLLLARLPLLQSIRLSAPPLFTAESGGEEGDAPPAAMFASVNLMATRDSDEYGRCGLLYAGMEDETLQEVIPLFQEALGSAVPAGTVEDTALREALNHPGLYLEFTGGPLSLEAAAAWLGEDAPFPSVVRSMALTAEGDEGATLFLLDGEGAITRCATALPVSALRSSCEKISPNGSYFAYETGYTTLAPYTVLMPRVAPPPDVTAERPAGYSAYNLLTALDFNAHTLSRYTESSGAEVVEESPRTLRIGPNGNVSFISRGTIASPLYRASGTGLGEVLAAGGRLASALAGGTGSSSLFLQSVEETETGRVLRFRYQVDGIPVYFSDGSDALTVTFQGASVTGFTYRCRAYTPSEEAPAALLPAGMAQAIAAAYPDSALSIGYEDDGSGYLTAQWYR